MFSAVQSAEKLVYLDICDMYQCIVDAREEILRGAGTAKVPTVSEGRKTWQTIPSKLAKKRKPHSESADSAYRSWKM